MSEEVNDEGHLRKYLLGELKEAEQQALEERLMTETELFALLPVVEDELIEDYLGELLSSDERGKFESLFVSTAERRRKLSFAMALRRYITTEGTAAAAAEEPTTVGQSPRISPGPSSVIGHATWWNRAFSTPYLRLAAAAVIVLAVGLGSWRAYLYFRQPQVSKGIATLREAYRDQRPTEARITELFYAPPAPTTRGPERDKFDYVALDRAKALIQLEANEHPSVQSYHDLGRLYLALGDFDKAIDQFEKALKLNERNAQLQSDLGAALAEKAGAKVTNDQSDSGIDELTSSLEHLNRALDLDSNLLEALFNRALVHQKLLLWRQAEADWRQYLEKDDATQWAAEAKERLKEIQNQRGKISQQHNLGVDDLVDSCAAGEEMKAWAVARNNRDVISGRLIWEQLAASALKDSSAGLKDQAHLKILSIACEGKMESSRVGDPFVSELATFYSNLTPRKMALVADAHSLVERGRARYFDANYEQARNLFHRASLRFDEAGNLWEATLARLRVVHCYLPTGRANESLSALVPLGQFCEKHNYLWLLAHVFNSKARAQTMLSESSKYVENISRSLEIFEKINDEPAIQKGLAQLAMKYGALGDHNAAMETLDRCLAKARNFWPGARQAWRNYDSTATILGALGRETAAVAFELEALQLSLEEIKDPSFTYLSLTRVGNLYGRHRDYGQAVQFAQRGLDTARNLPNERDRSAMVAFSLLQLGHIHRMAGSVSVALDYYQQAIKLSDAGNLQVYLYEGHKGQLLCHLSLQNDSAIREELAVTLNLFELCRSKITEETSLNTFIDQEQDIYDIAIDFEFSTMNSPGNAFELSEKSRARSLLAMINAPARVASRSNRPEIIIQPVSEFGDLQPLSKSKIEGDCPAGAQILQYAVLPNHLLIWVVSTNRFVPFKKEISADELSDRVNSYMKQVSQPPTDGANSERDAATQLFQILIEPTGDALDPKKLICVVPDKFLNYLPFGALFSSTAAKRLVEMHEMMTSPSSTIFLRCTDDAKKRGRVRSERAVAIGDPMFDRHLADLPYLQSAESEVRELAKYYSRDSCVLTGKSATKSQVKSEMQRSDMIHFAAHYIIIDKHPQLSGLLLAESPSRQTQESDGVFHSYEIIGLDLRRARVVVLAACQTGVDRYFRGEGAIGFSRSFIAAGVPIVVATLWRVESTATKELMLDFHKNRSQGKSSVKALRNAQLNMIAEAEHHRDHPYYWACFAVVGGYAEF